MNKPSKAFRVTYQHPGNALDRSAVVIAHNAMDAGDAVVERALAMYRASYVGDVDPDTIINIIKIEQLDDDVLVVEYPEEEGSDEQQDHPAR